MVDSISKYNFSEVSWILIPIFANAYGHFGVRVGISTSLRVLIATDFSAKD